MRLVGLEFAAAGAALFDAAEGDNAGYDDDKADDRGNDGDLSSLRQGCPAVLDAVGLLDFLESLGFTPAYD